MKSFFADKKVLVTGAAGFIGSHLVESLLAAEAEVIGVDSFITGQQANVELFLDQPNFTFIEADVSQPPAEYLPPAVVSGQESLAAVFHFASPASPPLYQAHPVETYLVNSLGTHHLLQFLQEAHPAARFLFAGTSEAYGDPEVHPQPESYWGNVNPNGPRSCYDEAKRLGETICGVFHRKFGLDTRVVRIFNTYGSRMNPADGRVIPNFVTQALAGEKLTVHGDGSQTRSYCYVSDLVLGLLLFMADDTLGGETINLGNPAELTVQATAELIFHQVTGQDLSSDQIDRKPQPTDDPTRRQPDISKATQLLDWEPTVSFSEGLAVTIEYFSALSSDAG